MAEPFATADDLVARWRPLSESEQATAEALLADASAMIRAERPGIDELLAADPPGMDPSLPRMVACAMVKRAMIGIDTGGASSVQQTAGPFSKSTSFANPAGDLYFTRQERQALGGRAQRAFTVAISGEHQPVHLPWCSVTWGAPCSCGADLAGEPIFEG